MEREEVDILIKECCDPEDDDGFIPYERELSNVSQEPFNLVQTEIYISTLLHILAYSQNCPIY